MKTVRNLLLASSLIYTTNALATGAVSRACAFGEIPSYLQYVASTFFIVVGGDFAVINAVRNMPNVDQYNYYIFESLTTDYVETRYYLFAQADVYQRVYDWVYDPLTSTYGHFKPYKRFTSPGWEASAVSLALKRDERFAVYYENRGPLYSARAGNPAIVEYAPPATSISGPYKVVGHHKYFDIAAKRSVDQGITVAYDCNLNNFGVTHSGIFDR